MNKTIGALIKAYRKEIGLTQIDMAKIMKTSQSNVSKFESHILIPSLLQYRRLFRHVVQHDDDSVVHFDAFCKWMSG